MISKASVRGEFDIEVIDTLTNTTKEHTGFFSNMILDSFLADIQNRTSSYYFPNQPKYCRVGTGTTPPATNQTTLVNQIATATGGYASQSHYVESGLVINGSNWTADCTMTFIFATGAVVGNISEVGFAMPNVPNSTTVHSRALVTPQAITVTASDQLIVKYKLTISGTDVDGSGVVNLNGTNYSWISRRPAPAVMPVGDYLSANSASTSVPYAASNAVFNGVGQDVSGTSGTSASHTHQVGTVLGERRSQVFWSSTDGNVSGGIKCIQWGGLGKFEFTPAIPKDANKALTLVFSYILSRV